MTDAQLSPGFRLSSFPCWQRATAPDVVVMRWVAQRVLQPTANRWGRLTITSWTAWARTDCTEARTGDHADPGTVDFVPRLAPIEDVWRWMGANLKGRYGSLIFERDHIHYTRPNVGVRTGQTEFLYEPVEGVYRAEVPGMSSLAVGALAVAGLYVLVQSFADR